MDYRFSYEIDISADTPEEAVKQAMAIVRNPKAIATWDYVYEDSTNPDLVSGGRIDYLPNGTTEITDEW